MRTNQFTRIFQCALLAFIAYQVEVSAQQSAITTVPVFTAKDLSSLPTAAWLTNGGDVFNRRYSPLDQINRENVRQVKANWRVHLGSALEPKYSGEMQPIIYQGAIYAVTGADDVSAISIATGQILWSHAANLDSSNMDVCCGWASRGVAIGDGKVFVGQLDGQLVALNQQTGEVIWAIQTERWEEGFSITSAPLYYDGLVITGFAGGEFGVRGRVKAFNAKDGHLVWTFYTIPGPGERGHETWPANNEAWKRGGATVWQTPAVDPELGLIYFSTGNAGPDFNGSNRAGDNLFSSSIVALDARTGKYRWHFQQVHHDIWDYDGPNPVVLFDITINGAARKAVAQASKTGWVYILDRTTGKPLLGITEKPVQQEPRQFTSRTQPYPLGDAFVPQSLEVAPEGSRLVNEGRIFTPFWTEAVAAKPGQGGGANWGPSSYDPATGYFYVCAEDHTGLFTADDRNGESPVGQRYTGGRFGGPSWGMFGIFAALDMHTNKLVWQQQWPERCHGGSVVTAGGLVFVGRSDGRFTALNSKTGELLWQFQTGAGVNAPASVFEHQGQEYIAVYSGGSSFVSSPRGDSLWLFSLGGKLDPVPRLEDAIKSASAATAAPVNLANGRAVFESSCAPCHGERGQGGPGGGPALMASIDRKSVALVVTEGRGHMPAFGGTLTPEQIGDVTEHVVQVLPH